MAKRNYEDKLYALYASGRLPPGALSFVDMIVDIRHDDTCPMLAGSSECNCDPDIVFDGQVVELEEE